MPRFSKYTTGTGERGIHRLPLTARESVRSVGVRGVDKSVFSCSVSVISAASLSLPTPPPMKIFFLCYPTIFSIPRTSPIPHNYLPNPPPSLLFPSISISPSLLSRRLSTLIYPDRSQGSLCLLHLPRGLSPTFPLIPSQRPTVNRVSVIPPYVISRLIPSISHD